MMIEKQLPVILIFALGYTLKALSIFDKKDSELFLKLFYFVAIPAMMLVSVTQMKFTLELLWLPVIAVMVILILFAVSFVVGRRFNLERPSFGVFLVGSLVMNVAFTYPFLLAARGEEALALAALFDFGNTIFIFTFIYYLACRYGSNTLDSLVMLKKLLVCPPFMALLFALFLNINQIQLPGVALQFFKILGNMTIPLVMLSLGILFSPKVLRVWPLVSVLFIRMGLGLLLGFLFVCLFDLQGLSRTVVLICCSAPAGINTVVFSSLEKLDSEFAASVVSYSVLLGMFMVPLLLHLCD